MPTNRWITSVRRLVRAGLSADERNWGGRSKVALARSEFNEGGSCLVSCVGRFY